MILIHGDVKIVSKLHLVFATSEPAAKYVLMLEEKVSRIQVSDNMREGYMSN